MDHVVPRALFVRVGPDVFRVLQFSCVVGWLCGGLAVCGQCGLAVCGLCVWCKCGGMDVHCSAFNYESAHKPHPLGVEKCSKRAFIRSEANIFSAHGG